MIYGIRSTAGQHITRCLMITHQGTFLRQVHTTTMLRGPLQTVFTYLLCTFNFVRYLVRSQICCYPFRFISILTYASLTRDEHRVCSIFHAFHPSIPSSISSLARSVCFIQRIAISLSNLCVSIVRVTIKICR